MIKKRVLIVIMAVTVCFGMFICLKAQNVSENQPFVTIMLQRFGELEAKIDKISGGAAPAAKPVDTRSQEIVSRLDQILANQQKILQELEVVKVRATRK
jgi:hypothetical protein